MTLAVFEIDLAWNASHPLPDGSLATLRLVRPEDKPLFVRAAAEFSEDTMARRFFGSKRSFSEKELSYLTEVDEFDHLAIVAVRKDETGEWQGLAAARYIRDPEAVTVAEFAIIVGDQWQNCGLGTALLTFLALAARDRGVLRFKGDILSDNSRAFRLIDRFAPEAVWLTNGIVALVEFDLAPILKSRAVDTWNS